MEKSRFASALSTRHDLEEALAEVVAGVRQDLAGCRPDLLAVFATRHYGAPLAGIGPRLREDTGAGAVVGCTGESIIGGQREVEGQAGLALWAAHLPGTRVQPFEVQAMQGPDRRPVFSPAPEPESAERSSVLLLVDPFRFPVDLYLRHLNQALPGVPVMGGLASGGESAGQNLLFTGAGLASAGASGVLLEGEIELRSVVSQGCRPVGKPWVVTACDRNAIHKLGGRPAGDVLVETLNSLSPGDRELFRHGAFVGLAVDPTRSEFERGDFLVRVIVDMDQTSRALLVTDMVRRGQTIQFLTRDAESAGEDLEQLLRSQGGGELASPDEPWRAGALLFTCNGRGTRMFAVPDHDATCVRKGLAAEVPVAGFFAGGEIGPVGGQNFLHGFTASVAIFRPRA